MARLTDAQIARFCAEGVLAIPNFFSQEQISDWRDQTYAHHSADRGDPSTYDALGCAFFSNKASSEGGGGSEEVLVGQASLRCAPPLKPARFVQLELTANCSAGDRRWCREASHARGRGAIEGRRRRRRGVRRQMGWRAASMSS